MSKRMLIDASHPEETRVVVLDGNKVDEFDFESASRRPLKGNIYLAKVTRVEPSLQAAFVEYGGNRQGFLAFAEIHPDYYQIPVADRLALIADQSRRLMAEDDDIDAVPMAKPGSLPPSSDTEEEEEESVESTEDGGNLVEVHEVSDIQDPLSHDHGHAHDHGHEHTHEDGVAHTHDHGHDHIHEHDHDHAHDQDHEHCDDGHAHDHGDHDHNHSHDHDHAHDHSHDHDHDHEHAHDDAEALSADRGGGDASKKTDVVAEATGIRPNDNRRRSPRPPRRRQYKIQEVIRRKQIILVQVVKEERGNKGASLTTYLSLAGRYCVLMPNTPRGGGISRKITSATDRKRLKSAAQSLELPEGTGLIIRTAGANRTKLEIKRDYEYLLRLWDSVRELTLRSNAPSLVYEEGNLIKRAIRDLYGKDISEVIVDGEAGYRDAKDFMRMLMPSHAKNVKPYRDTLPLFQSKHVEAQLDAMFSPVVTLKSGGYIVINQTEALVSIDVNSGKATREHSIEDTAYKTNLEAADEIARQMRLRDLAGLLVIDFIDMEDGKNDRNVEKRLRDALRNDRARIQIGKISQFGLLEMSRQRLRAGVLAGSTVACPHCEGLGYIRSTESAALRLLRSLDEEGQQLTVASVLVRAPSKIVIYTLNHKRAEIARIEQSYEMSVLFDTRDDMSGGSFEIERTATRSAAVAPKRAAISQESVFAEPEDEIEAEPDADIEDIAVETEGEAEEVSAAEPAAQEDARPQQGDDKNKRRRRRRRGGRGRSRDGAPGHEGAQSPGDTQRAGPREDATDGDDGDDTQGEERPRENGAEQQASGDEGGDRRKRRRRRGRRGRRRDNEPGSPDQGAPAQEGMNSLPENAADFGIVPNASSTPQWSLADEPAARGADIFEAPATASDEASAREQEQTVSEQASESAASDGPRKGGWWQRRFGL